MINAAMNGQLETVKAMLARGVPVDAKDNYGYTALMWGAGNGHLEVVRYLVEHAKANVEVKNKYGNTALDIAISWNKKNVADYLKVQATLRCTPRLDPMHPLPTPPKQPFVRCFFLRVLFVCFCSFVFVRLGRGSQPFFSHFLSAFSSNFIFTFFLLIARTAFLFSMLVASSTITILFLPVLACVHVCWGAGVGFLSFFLFFLQSCNQL